MTPFVESFLKYNNLPVVGFIIEMAIWLSEGDLFRCADVIVIDWSADAAFDKGFSWKSTVVVVVLVDDWESVT